MKLICKFLLSIVFFSCYSCQTPSTPKPRGYFRITFPEREYELFDTLYPYRFEKPVYTKIVEDKHYNAEPYWINLEYPAYQAKVHISYKSIDNNLEEILEDTRKLAYKHTIKADALKESLFLESDKKVYGILYSIEGNAASQLQFTMTDSTKHFLRGSLYFDVVPNKDSLAPVVDFIREDVIHLIESLEWKKLPN